MSSLRKDTFKKVAESLDAAVVDLESAAKELKDSIYWSNTSEYHDIMKLVREAKHLSTSFKA